MALIQDDISDRDAILQHYAEVAIPKTYLQVDGWVNPDGQIDSTVNPDGSRLSLTAGATQELWRGDYALRIHINPTTNPSDVIDLLKQAVTWLEGDLGLLQIATYEGGHPHEEPPEWMEPPENIGINGELF